MARFCLQKKASKSSTGTIMFSKLNKFKIELFLQYDFKPKKKQSRNFTFIFVLILLTDDRYFSRLDYSLQYDFKQKKAVAHFEL